MVLTMTTFLTQPTPETSGAPFPVGTLKPPITDAQFSVLQTYFRAKGYVLTRTHIGIVTKWVYVIHPDVMGSDTSADIKTGSDSAVITNYEALVKGQQIAHGGVSQPYQGPGAGIVHGISSVTDFLKLLADSNTWLRVVEVLLGALLIGVGLAHITGIDKAALKGAMAL